MRDYCKFCRGGNNYHTADCSRNTPGAEERYEEGYLDGRRGRKRTGDDEAYWAGYLAGEVALESYENGDRWMNP
jgi:hypothetical protein